MHKLNFLPNIKQSLAHSIFIDLKSHFITNKSSQPLLRISLRWESRPTFPVCVSLGLQLWKNVYKIQIRNEHGWSRCRWYTLQRRISSYLQIYLHSYWAIPSNDLEISTRRNLRKFEAPNVASSWSLFKYFSLPWLMKIRDFHEVFVWSAHKHTLVNYWN